jgi:hypothetical protein
MRLWHRQFLGRTQPPPTLSAMAISEFFTLDGVEARAVLSRYGMDMRLGSALQISGGGAFAVGNAFDVTKSAATGVAIFVPEGWPEFTEFAMETVT